MAVYVKKAAIGIFLMGLLVLSILSLLGMVYMTKMAFNNDVQVDGKYCGDLTETERNIARLSLLSVWCLIAWVVVGSAFKSMCLSCF